MNEKEMLLRRLSALDFAIWELHIFLNTHPNNTQALKQYNDYNEKRMVLQEEYEQKFGPLPFECRSDEQKWTWVNSPWPWENEKGVN